MNPLSLNYKLHLGVEMGPGAVIGDYCIVGVPPSRRSEGELATVIGPDALLRSHTVIYAGNHIGARFATGHGALVREENSIGDDVSIGSHAIIEHHVTLANGVRVHSGAFIPEFSVLEEGAWVGPHVIFTNVLHPLCPEVAKCIKGPTIGAGAKIGANSTLLPGIVIGSMALIAAGSVVVHDVPARAVVAGNPARVIKTIDELGCPWDYISHPYPTEDPRP